MKITSEPLDAALLAKHPVYFWTRAILLGLLFLALCNVPVLLILWENGCIDATAEEMLRMVVTTFGTLILVELLGAIIEKAVIKFL